MNFSETPTQVLSFIESLLLVVERVVNVVQKLKLLRPSALPYSYENLLLEFSLDLKSPTGRTAILTRRQRVRFLTAEAGVLSSPVWGEGSQLKRYALAGARRLGVRSDGSRQVLLLGLSRSAERDKITQVVSRQTVADGYLRRQEYLEALVERPTKRLTLKAVFPKGRPPSEAYLATSSVRSERLPLRIGRDGRARISWSMANPVLDIVYSMRWTW